MYIRSTSISLDEPIDFSWDDDDGDDVPSRRTSFQCLLYSPLTREQGTPRLSHNTWKIICLVRLDLI